MQTSQRFFGVRWAKIAACVGVILILTAVPAAALTWTTAWTSGFGTKGTVVVVATNNTAGAMGPSTLTINFGTSGGAKASGKFKASRSYMLAAGETRLSIVQTIRQQIQDAGGASGSIKVKVKRGTVSVSGSIKGIYDQSSPSTITASGA